MAPSHLRLNPRHAESPVNDPHSLLLDSVDFKKNINKPPPGVMQAPHLVFAQQIIQCIWSEH